MQIIMNQATQFNRRCEQLNIRLAPFGSICQLVGEVVPRQPEPMFNLLTLFAENRWKTYLFPRRTHRPSQFFETGEKRIVFSPGAVDFGGVVILPVKKDFNRLDGGMLRDLFAQLTFQEDEFSTLKKLIKNFRLC